jgi:hypothetical protein
MKAKSTLRALLAWSAFAATLLACSFFSRLAPSAPSPTAPGIPPTFTFVPAPIPTNTPLSLPTNTARPQNTPTEETPSCYRWDEITIQMAGQTVCVYGVAYSHQGQSRIDFSPAPNTFFLIDTVYYYPNLESGTCVVAEQKVEVFDHSIPFMTINGELYNCEAWMEE